MGTEFVQIIQSLGFPIACVIACGFFIYKTITRDKDEAKEREDRLIEANMKNSDALGRVADTINDANALNKELSEKNKMLTTIIDDKLVKIETDVVHIKDAVESK